MPTPAQILAPCLEKIVEAASGRKYTKIRHDAKDLLKRVDDLVKPPSPLSRLQQQELHHDRASHSQKPTLQSLPELEIPSSAPAPETPTPGEAARTTTTDSEQTAGGDAAPAEAFSTHGTEGDEQVKLVLDPETGEFRVQVELSKDAAARTPAASGSVPESPSQPAAPAPAPAHTVTTIGASPAPARAELTDGGTPAHSEHLSHRAEADSYRGSIRLQSAKALAELLRAAVETRKVQLVDCSLDCIQKLIAHNFLGGAVHNITHKREAATRQAGRKRPAGDEDGDDAAAGDWESLPPQAQAVELLCRCDDIPDDGVELRVLKGLLTAITSSTLHVHGQALLLAVRTCYNIFLMSRSEVNQTTAKASLTQMLNVVFQRMEAGSEAVVVPPITVSDVLGLPSAETSSMTAYVQAFLHDVVTSVDPFGYYAEGLQAHLDVAFHGAPESSYGDPTEREPESPDSAGPMEKIDWRPSPSREASEATEVGHSAAVDASPAGDAALAAAEGGALALQQEGLGAAVSPASITAEASNLAGGAQQWSGADAHGMPAADASNHTSAPPADGASEPQTARSLVRQATVNNMLQKDAFLVFRALCKLSIRTSEATAGPDLTAIRGKVLALELLKILLENSGEVFRTTEKFTSAIKQYLCLSLLKNCASTIPQALALSCSIFLTLMAKFRHSLKAEIGVFFPMILLRAIEPAAAGTTPNAAGPTGTAGAVDGGHKQVVMKCLQAQCESGQLLVDLFVNYDCDLEGANLFERMVLALVRVAQSTPSPDAPAAVQQEESLLRVQALQCLVNVLRSLVEWYTNAAPAAVAAVIGEEVPVEAPVVDVDDAVKQSWEHLTSSTSNAAAGTGGTDADGVALVSPGRPPLKRDQSSIFTAAQLPDDIAAQLKDADSAREAQLLETWKAYKKGFQEGIALFNQKPRKGVQFMQEQNMLGRTPEDIAKFLAKTTGLNKTMIGEYLGEREETCLKVMHAYVDAMDFTDTEFDAAIRTFLDGFRLPGEAQKIDRLMEKFAERYVSCNPEAFKSADVAYVLAYSVIMLNTDAHNPQVKVKMSKQDFLRNNRGINDGGDLPEDYMGALYDRIVNNEIKMKEAGLAVAGPAKGAPGAPGAGGGGWMDTILNLIPGRKQQTSMEPSEESIKRTHEFLREKAKGATFFEATEGETVRPMLDVAWAPMLGAFSVLFEQHSENTVVNLCLAGFVAAIRITSLLNMGMLRNTFVTSVARFTMLHAPANMQIKNAKAFRALLVIADENGNNLHEVWHEVLRCVSQFEFLQQMQSGGPSDASLFAQPVAPESPSSVAGKLRSRLFASRSSPAKGGDAGGNGRVMQDSFSSVSDGHHHGRGKTRSNTHEHFVGPPEAVLREIDAQELNRMFVRSDRLDSEAIVMFVRALCDTALDELRPVAAPRVYSMTKIVEIAHFNMTRIRLVWSRIWAVLSDFFVEVGCHKNLAVAMYAVDSLRQLAMKFLERDELANYTFQNDFLKPFVVVMRQSKAVEIRELIIRCVSQMVLARVANVKSGWKSMFMVFTTAAGDEQQTIVRLAFETIEKIVREHFDYITETEITTFTDCVNCLIAFTNNPHSLDVSLNAIAFLRFCAMKLAEGAIGDVEELPEGTPAQRVDPNAFRIRPSAHEPDSGEPSSSRRATLDDLPSAAASPSSTAPVHANEERPSPASMGSGAILSLQFSDKDEHMYFWFPLLAGLSELTFDPRPDIRYSALEVLFDTLKFHGHAFTAAFWTRIFDSVLLPIFDHVRAEVTDLTSFTDEKRRQEVDAWLYETCTQCLQHMVDVVVQFYPIVQGLLGRILDLLSNFMRRTHQSLAAVGVAALVRLTSAAGSQMSTAVWDEVVHVVSQAHQDTVPAVAELVASLRRPASSTSMDGGGFNEVINSPGRSSPGKRHVSLVEGAGARRLSETRTRAAIQLLLVQACGEIYSTHSGRLSESATVEMLDTVRSICDHTREVDADMHLRGLLALAQQEDRVPEARQLADPPLLRLESEASHAYLSMLLHIQAAGNPELRAAAGVEGRLVAQCCANLERFQALEAPLPPGLEGKHLSLASRKEENSARAPLTVATLRAMLAFPDAAFRAHLKEFFPLLTRLISCEHAPPEVQRTLSDLFTKRIGPLLQAA